MNTRKLLLALACLSAGHLMVDAASLVVRDGSRLEGDLVKIDGGKVYFRTAFAGVLEVAQDQVVSISSDAPVSLRTANGEVFTGPVAPAEAGRVAVRSAAGAATASISAVTSAWGAGERDPQAVAAEAAAKAQQRAWAYSLGFDLTGSDGNSRTFAIGLRFTATLEGPQDRLGFYGSYLYQKDNGVRSKDEQIAGVRYTNFFSDKMGWFVRQELERDSFEGIDFRSTSAVGLTYRFINEERMTLEGSAGLSYRYEDYKDPALNGDGFPGLDFGLAYMWQFADWGKLNTTLNYLPSFDDFGEYLIDHESSVDVPLGRADFWVLRFGLGNKYNSQPAAGRKDLDTTYFVRLLLNWN